MMKIFLVLLLMSVFPGGDQECKMTVEGYLQLTGTDHFPDLAIITRDQQQFLLDLEEEAKDSLWNHRAKPVRITGTAYKSQWMGETRIFLRPKKIKWIQSRDD